MVVVVVVVAAVMISMAYMYLSIYQPLLEPTAEYGFVWGVLAGMAIRSS